MSHRHSAAAPGSLKDWRVRIEDMLEALARIDRYTRSLDRASFVDDEKTVDAVVRNLEVLGEAANRIPPDIAHRFPQIPWHKMAEVRHILVHEYHAVNPDLIWSTIRHDIPPLVAPLRALLHDSGVS